MTGAIVRKELAVVWSSPLPWIAGALFHGLLGLLYVNELAARGQALFQPLVPLAGFLLIVTAPVITMRSFAEEARAGTLALLQSIPVAPWRLALGKWLAAWVTAVVVLAPIAVHVLLLHLFAEPDAGPIVAGIGGLVLFAGAVVAIGVLVSALTDSQPLAAVATFVATLVLWFAHAGSESVTTGPVLVRLSLSERLRSFAAGAIDTGDVAFFVVLAAAAIALAAIALDLARWR